MAQLVDDNPGTHIFCDEVPVGGVAGISVKFLVELSKRIDRKLFLWLACNHAGHLDERSEGRFVETISTLAKTYPGLPLADPSNIG